MGKGDKKTTKGKRWRGSYGKTRDKKPNRVKKSGN
ncbi:MAG: 30S ribosomal protein THX [Saprospiraceae bacterium]|nr:30S ribosomal protein THX [Saprospiraceae bacterium]